jgi:hypothetical protein
MTALVRNATSRRQKVGDRPPLSGGQNELKKSAGGAAAALAQNDLSPRFSGEPDPSVRVHGMLFRRYVRYPVPDDLSEVDGLIL